MSGIRGMGMLGAPLRVSSCDLPLFRAASNEIEGDRCRPRPQLTFRELSTDARAVVSHSIDRAVVVVGDQHRAVLEDHEVSRASDIIVVFNEARDEWIDGFHR